MLRLSLLLVPLVALAPALTAQPAADSALVAQIYADLARGDVEAVVAVLDDHVFWTEDAHSPQAGRHVGGGTVAAQVLRPLIAADGADVPHAITTQDGHVVAIGMSHRHDSATGQLATAHFRHVWKVGGGHVVSVHRSHEEPYRPPSDPCDLEAC